MDELLGDILGFISKLLGPIADALNSEYLSSENKLLISSKLQKWLDEKINELVNSPIGLQSTKDMDLNLQNEDALRHAYSTAEASKLHHACFHSGLTGRIAVENW